jgi:aspartate/methionine/tyrosine aminotransferase
MDPEFPLSILNMNYSLAIASGSLSKAYSLAGIRVGWIAARDPTIIEALASVRDYTTISVSQVDEQIAAFAVGPYTVHALLTRNIELAKTNLALLDAWVEKHRWACEWVKPVAGSTGFVKFQKMGTPVDDVVFCQTLQEKSGVMFVPGSRCFGEEFKGYVRVGFVCETEVLREGLDALTQFMKTDYKNIPEVA